METPISSQVKVMRINNWDEPSDLILVLRLDIGRVLEILEWPIDSGTLEKVPELHAITVE